MCVACGIPASSLALRARLRISTIKYRSARAPGPAHSATAVEVSRSTAKGISLTNTQPWPGILRTWMSPPCALMALRAIERPRPRPDRSAPAAIAENLKQVPLVLRKTSALVFELRRPAVPSSARAPSTTRPPGGVFSKALCKRFIDGGREELRVALETQVRIDACDPELNVPVLSMEHSPPRRFRRLTRLRTVAYCAGSPAARRTSARRAIDDRPADSSSCDQAPPQCFR